MISENSSKMMTIAMMNVPIMTILYACYFYYCCNWVFGFFSCCRISCPCRCTWDGHHFRQFHARHPLHLNCSYFNYPRNRYLPNMMTSYLFFYYLKFKTYNLIFYNLTSFFFYFFKFTIY